MDCFVASLLAMTTEYDLVPSAAFLTGPSGWRVCVRKKMAPCGAISVSCSVGVMTLLDNHHLVGAMMAPASVQAEVPMFAELGARTHVMMMGAALDHDGLSACN